MSADARMSEVSIVAAASSHVDALAELQLDLIRYMAQIAPEGFGKSLTEPPAFEEIKATFVEAIDDPATRLLVAETGQRLAGFVMGVIEEHTDDLISAPFLTVQYVGVLKEYRRNGIAARLLAEMETWAKSRGITQIDLLVWEHNPDARALFTKLGYMPLEHRLAKTI